MNWTPYPNNGCDSFPLGRRVTVYYRNLHKDTWDVHDKKTGLVLGYADTIALEDCRMFVNQKEREHAIEGNQEHRHAWVEGTVIPAPASHGTERIAYDPHQYHSFFYASTGQPISETEVVVMVDGRIYEITKNKHHKQAVYTT